MGQFILVFLSIVAIVIFLMFLVISSPIRVFVDNDIPAWKAFIPIYNMWTFFKEYIENSFLFWVWFILVTIGFGLIMSEMASGSNSPVGALVVFASMLPGVRVFENGIYTGLCFLFLMTASAFIPLTFIVYPFII